MVPHEDLVQLYSHATAFVCPSVYEPFGLINLEAMACERPVVASAVGGIPEVVVDGETGFLVPPGDAEALASAMGRVLKDPAMAARMGTCRPPEGGGKVYLGGHCAPDPGGLRGSLGAVQAVI